MSKIKEGDILIAIDPCEMDNGEGNALTVGKEYSVVSKCKEDYIEIVDDFGSDHIFYIDRLDEFFKVKPSAIDEAIEIIETLMSYGNIRPIEGVVYPQGTHKEMLKKADEWLSKNRINN